MSRVTGRYVIHEIGGEKVSAFVPRPLPPANPALRLDDLMRPLQNAERGLGRLDIAGGMVPSLDWFLYAFVRKEAVVSSQIEGTQASLVDLLEFEAGAGASDAVDDVREVCNYIEALAYAREQLRRPKGLPLSIRLLNETHRRLMKGVRGAEKRPGEVRTSQNWIGGTRPGNAAFVPPPPHAVPGLLSALEQYMHKTNGLPPLVRIGLVHVQFETIHPYLDGNGRIGRLLITLLLEEWNLLASPLLYLSLHFKRHRSDYYRLLGAVRENGDWNAWLAFFLDGVCEISNEALETALALFALVAEDRSRVLDAPTASVMALRLFEALPRHPIVTIPSVVGHLHTTKPTAAKAVSALEQIGILKETTGRRRDRTYAYGGYLDRLRVGTETRGRA